VATFECFYTLAIRKLFHADEARLFLGAAFVPHACRDAVNLLLCVATTYMSSILLKFHKLFIRHTIHIWVVRVISRGHILRLLNCSLQEPIFFGLGLLSPSSLMHSHHYHLSLIDPILDLIHMHGHLHLRHDILLQISLPISPLSFSPINISVPCSDRHQPCFSQIVSLFTFSCLCIVILLRSLICCSFFRTLKTCF
jgi:hypothetical protein